MANALLLFCGVRLASASMMPGAMLLAHEAGAGLPGPIPAVAANQEIVVLPLGTLQRNWATRGDLKEQESKLLAQRLQGTTGHARAIPSMANAACPAARFGR